MTPSPNKPNHPVKCHGKSVAITPSGPLDSSFRNFSTSRCSAAFFANSSALSFHSLGMRHPWRYNKHAYRDNGTDWRDIHTNQQEGRAAWRSLVFATDSEYVAVNSTERIERWEATGWKLASYKGRTPEPVKNQDLWKLLLKQIQCLQGNGVNVAFSLYLFNYMPMGDIRTQSQPGDCFARCANMLHRCISKSLEGRFCG